MLTLFNISVCVFVVKHFQTYRVIIILINITIIAFIFYRKITLMNKYLIIAVGRYYPWFFARLNSSHSRFYYIEPEMLILDSKLFYGPFVLQIYTLAELSSVESLRFKKCFPVPGLIQLIHHSLLIHWIFHVVSGPFTHRKLWCSLTLLNCLILHSRSWLKTFPNQDLKINNTLM